MLANTFGEGDPPPDFVWCLPIGKRVDGGWYFDYKLQPLRLIIDEQTERFGGAPGFLVTDREEIRVIGTHELCNLANSGG